MAEPLRRRSAPTLPALALAVLGPLAAGLAACRGGGLPVERLHASDARPAAPRPGAAGVGDPYYPLAGNGGYDVAHYDVALAVDPDSGRIEAVATIDAVATHDLSSFHLDLWGLEVEAVDVDGESARFTRDGRELAVTPAAWIASGRPFRAVVRYGGVPELVPDASVGRMGIPGVGWWKRESGIYTISECTGAASWLPCNDHPRDKATFTFAVRVPEPWIVAANGLLEGIDEEDGQRTFRWRASDPMATYLATVNVVQLELERSEGPGGLPLRLYHPADASEDELAGFRRAGEMIAFFETRFGPYPFEAFGGLLAPETFGGALETQTLPVYSRGMGEGTVAHELAHQWFGNCVGPSLWRDVWLNEGFASYAEWLWREHDRGPEALERRVRRVYRFVRAREVGPPVDPGVERLFGASTYQRGALLLHALRLELGDERFFELLRRWVAEHHDAVASTEDFVALAERVAERPLKAFFDAWLRAPVIPSVERWEGTDEDQPRRGRRPDGEGEEGGGDRR